MLLLFSALFLPLAIGTPRLYDVRQLTDGGDHSYPRFSADGKAIYFTAKGGPYESKCEHVYRMDLRMPAQPISLVSTGIGVEQGVSFVLDLEMTTTRAVATTAGLSLLKQSDPYDGFTDKDFCQPSVCSQSGLSATTQANCQQPHEERQPFSEPIAFDTTGFVRSSPQSSGSWEDLPIFAHTQDIRMSGRAGDSGEIVNFTSYSDVLLLDVAGWAGGWEQTDTFAFNGQLLFHGASLASAEQQASVKEGVLPLAQTSIFRTSQAALKRGTLDLGSPILPATSTAYFLDPRVYQGDNVHFFYTLVEASSGRPAIYFHGENGETLIRNQAHHLDDISLKGNDFVTFVAKPAGGTEYQVFLAAVDNFGPFPTYTPIPWPLVDSPSPFLTNALKVYGKFEDGPRNLRISKDENWIMFLAAYEPRRYQVFQIYLFPRTSEVVRKLTVGDGHFSSPAFLSEKGGEDDILVVSSITNSKECLGSTTDVCNERVCTERATGDLKEACTGMNEEQFLSPHNEIFRLNPYGTIKQRLTNNTAFEGELAVSMDGRFVFSSNRDGDYELYTARLDTIDRPTAITNKLGFEDGCQFSPDGKWLAFYAWRPQTVEQKARYEKLRAHNTMDVAGDYQMYAINVETLEEVQLTDFSAPSSTRIRFAFTPFRPEFYFQRGGKLYAVNIETKIVVQYDPQGPNKPFDDFAISPLMYTFFAANEGNLLTAYFDPGPGHVLKAAKSTRTAGKWVKGWLLVMAFLFARLL